MNLMSAKHIQRWLLVAGLLMGWATAQAAEPKDILFSAIRDGSAKDVVTSRLAESIKGKTQSSEPILMSAKVVKRYRQEGCARLLITIHQEGVPKREGGVAPFEFSYEMNLCTDGLPPAESIDWSKIHQTPPSAPLGEIK